LEGHLYLDKLERKYRKEALQQIRKMGL
ncbi:peptide deformylase, partial [Mobiluncus curtisii]|nr:peptide deformylase [Mobiluncus curtisii]MCV0021962.1 peptide deformylase [Mobiluncus curtisii]